MPAVMSSVAKVDEDGFRMADVKETVGFRWESSENLSSGGFEMSVSEFGFDLRVAAWFVKLAKETFLKDGSKGSLGR